MLIEETLFGTIDKVQVAIERLKAFEPKDRPYWLAFSGGKDSCVILELAKMAGVKFEAHYNVTSVDPPELVRFVKNVHPEVSFDIPHDKQGKPISMWSLIKATTMPPTRVMRYCCKNLKESSGKGTITITGVRWAESVNRKLNQGMVTLQGNDKTNDELIKIGARETMRGGVVLNDDNDEARRSVEVCYRTKKTLVNPIIDWSDDEVWEFIHKYNVPYCNLYDKGSTRLGCIGCPMGGKNGMESQFKRYPKYREQYIRCFEKMIQNRREKGLVDRRFDWQSGEDVMNWWIGISGKPIKQQLSLLDMEEEE